MRRNFADLGKWCLSRLPILQSLRLFTNRNSFDATHPLYRLPVLKGLMALVLWEDAYLAAVSKDSVALRKALRKIAEHPHACRYSHYFQRLMQHVNNHPDCKQDVLAAILSNLLQFPRNRDLLFTAIAAQRSMDSPVPSWLEMQARLVSSGDFGGIEFELVDLKEAATDFQIVEQPSAYKKLIPAIVGDKVLNAESLPALTPIIRKASLTDVVVHGSGLVVRTDPTPTIILHESGIDLAATYTAGHRHFVDGAISESRIVTRMPAKSGPFIPKGILLGARAAGNYFHWLIEYMPRLLLVEDDPALADHDLLVRGPLHIQQLQALASLAPGRTVRAWKDDTSISVGQLVVIDGPNFVSDDPWQPSEDIFDCNPTLLGRMKDRILQSTGLVDAAGSRRIYLARQGGRDVLNSSVVDFLKAQGFEAVHPERLSFYDQIKLFRESAIIAGPSGAAFTNLLFCREGTKAMIFNAPRHARNSVFSQLADIAGAEVAQVIGLDRERHYFGGVPSIEDDIHRGYEIPTARVRRALTWATSG